MVENLTLKQRFENDVAQHTLDVKLDQGGYRHLVCRQPDTIMYWFEVITTPGQLTISGDMGTYVFSRLKDMFEFFGTGPINPSYWGEKLLAYPANGYRRYNPELARRQALSNLNEQAEWRDIIEPESLDRAKGDLRALVLSQAEDEREFREALDAFDVDGFHFSDTWEWDFNDYTVQYMWCCHAIVWAITRYRELQQAAVTGQPAVVVAHG